MKVLVLAALVGCGAVAHSLRGAETAIRRVTIVLSPAAAPIEQNVAELLSERFAAQTGVPAEVVREGVVAARDGLTVVLGVPAEGGELRALLEKHRVPLPGRQDPGPEGFVLKAVPSAGGVVIAAAGVDGRGVLYAAGELLRRAIPAEHGFVFPTDLHVRTAPAFRVRGTEVGQGATMRELTGARAWTGEEWKRAVLDYALAGANTFGGGAKEFAFLKSYGLRVVGHASPNALAGHPEWEAVEPIGRVNFVCPSIPAARQALLERVDHAFRNSPPYDIIRIPSGDAGGCWCERCEPWGKTYVLLCEEMAKIILKYLPGARIYITNQELSNAGDRFIFEYLNQAPRTWLAGMYFGPGSNALSWNGAKRPDHRLDLLEYPAFGLFDRYLREMLHEFPRRQSLLLFTDLTHWFSAQYGFLASDPMRDFTGAPPPERDAWYYAQRPDPALLKVHNRRTFFARPRAYHRIFQETARYTEGDITYSEGHHDHFNQWMWQRLLWTPHTPLEEALREYTRVWFGPEAAPLMAEALLQLEQNLTAPLADNDGIDRYYRLVEQAGEKMPAQIMNRSYLWRQHVQKACIDKYVQLRLRRQSALKRDIEARFDAALSNGDFAGAAAHAKARLREPADSPEMARLREEAGTRGAESERLFGVRLTGYFHLDQDLVGLGWIERQVQRLEAEAPSGRRGIARLIARYEDPGEGGFYDDAGDFTRSPRMTHGRQYSANNYLSGNVSNANLPSQRTMAHTDDDPRGVTFEYSGLDPRARYRVRLAFVRPRFLPRYAGMHPEKSQSVYADGHLVAANVELPEWDAELFEYAIPPELTADGKLTIWLQKSPEIDRRPVPRNQQWKRTAGWGTLVSDVWLLRAGAE